jgi:hypothetical protein
MDEAKKQIFQETFLLIADKLSELSSDNDHKTVKYGMTLKSR